MKNFENINIAPLDDVFHIHNGNNCQDSVQSNYVSQFIMNTKTYLPNNRLLRIDLQIFDTIIYDFEKEAVLVNCAKVKYPDIQSSVRPDEDFDVYFPNAIIARFLYNYQNKMNKRHLNRL